MGNANCSYSEKEKYICNLLTVDAKLQNYVTRSIKFVKSKNFSKRLRSFKLGHKTV